MENMIKWKSFNVQQIFEEEKIHFKLEGEVFVGKKIFIIKQRPRKGSFSNIAKWLLDILIQEKLITKKPRITHRISCEPGSPLNHGIVVTVIVRENRNGEIVSSTDSSQDPIKAYLFAIVGALNKLIDNKKSP